MAIGIENSLAILLDEKFACVMQFIKTFDLVVGNLTWTPWSAQNVHIIYRCRPIQGAEITWEIEEVTLR